MMIVRIIIFSFCPIFICCDSAPPSPPTNGHSMSGAGQGLVVNTTSGHVHGSKHVLSDGVHVRSWLGLPYAEPPVGKRRFLPPIPASPWTGIRDSVLLPPACPQSSKFSVSSSNNTSEDCLYLNIYSAESDHDQLKPVMIWIHPGEFNYGSASLVTPSRLAASGDVIVVSIQYRLGALGFIYFGDKSQANLGLQDQLLSIEWISQNIIHFGGDPTRVTLFGSEAGAVSAGYHVSNIHVSRLIHAAILQSGGPHNHWAKLDEKIAYDRSNQLVDKLGCTGQQEYMECLQNVSVDVILSEQNSVCEHNIRNINCFVPVLDGEIVQQNLSSTLNNKIMFGYNSNEGFLKLMQFLTKEFPTEKLYTEGFSQEIFMKMLKRMFPNTDNKVASMIDFLYQDVEAPTQASRRFLKLERIVTDFLTSCSGPGVDEDGSRYKFTWQPSKDKWPRWSGVKQGDEIQFIFGEPIDNPEDYLIEEKEFSKAMMKFWTEFARTGSPANVTGLTLPLPLPSQQIIELNAVKSGLLSLTDSQAQKCKFWNELFDKLSEEEEDKKCKTVATVKEKKKVDQKVQELQNNEIEPIAPNYRSYSPIYVDQPIAQTVRKERGLYQDSYSYPNQFVYKVKTKVPKNKNSNVATAVLERSMMKQKVFKRQIKPENNTQLSYQLNVGLNNGNNQAGEAFAVYNTQQLGNSPIYIAPNKYQVRDPIFNDDNLNDFRGNNNNYVRNVAAHHPAPVKKIVPTSSPQKFSSFDDTRPEPASFDHLNDGTGYDPFFPGFGAKIQKSPLVKQPAPAVSLAPQHHRSYFPN